MSERLRVAVVWASGFVGGAVAAALEDFRYPLDDLVFDLANLFATDRFSGTNPRWLGRLASVCERTYRRSEAEGFLVRGVPSLRARGLRGRGASRSMVIVDCGSGW